jgi:hypothetical protein
MRRQGVQSSYSGRWFVRVRERVSVGVREGVACWVGRGGVGEEEEEGEVVDMVGGERCF